MVTGYEETLAVLRAPAIFSSATIVAGPDPMSLFPVRPEGDDITRFVNGTREYLPQNDQIVSSDPPSHTAQRALLMGLITPKRLKENEEFIWRLTDRQLDVILPRGTAEVIGGYAQPYTLLVIADLLGIPEEDHAMLLDAWGEKLSSARSDSTRAGPRTEKELSSARSDSTRAGPRTEKELSSARSDSSRAGPRTEKELSSARSDSTGAGPRTEKELSSARSDSTRAGPRTEKKPMPGTGDGQARGTARRHAGLNVLEVFYGYFSARIEERRRRPGTDVLSGMAAAKFPDGTAPEPLEVARIASNLFTAGQETTVRLIGTLL